MRAAGDLSHHVDVLALDRFLDEHGLIRLKRFDEDLGILWTDRAVEIDANVRVLSAGFTQRGETFSGFLDEFLRSNHAGLRCVLDAGLEGGEALLFALAQQRWIVADVRINPNAIARGAAEQFENGHAEEFSFYIPERLLEAAQRAGQNRAAARKGMTIN